MNENEERAAFEAWWAKEMNLLEMDLHRHEYPMMADKDQPYACYETQRSWLAWQAANLQTSKNLKREPA